MEIKLLKFLTKAKHYEMCDLPHAYFHLGVCQGMCVRSKASNGQGSNWANPLARLSSTSKG